MDLATKYTPADIEPQIAEKWNQANAFAANPDDQGPPYCIVIPPPNVTAALHMGHALNNTIQDILIRWRRMCGDNAVWIPGTDHAGIATQTVVEKRVLAEEGKKRTDFERDEFVARIQAWKDEYEVRITEQLKAMGCSCDWDRQRFTMDQTCAKAVREAFFKLFKDGLIYRGKRLVNWDPATQTALADDEVEMKEIDGHFWYMKYPLVEPIEIDGKRIEYVTVATTRPETMLGDTAVAVNPKDSWRAKLIGMQVKLPIVNRIIPIIGDDYVVLPDPDSSDEKAKYASGFLKVTPAHDPNDWEIGLRHNLDQINVMAPDGSISDQHGWPEEDFAMADENVVPLGMDRYEAREAIVDWFRTSKLLEEVRPYTHSVGHSYRSHVPIEPYLSDQWYVKVTDDRLAGAALRAMDADQYNNAGGDKQRISKGTVWEDKLRFYPPRYAKTFRGWHEGIRDWCISRQLWWGHQIPVWAATIGTNTNDPLKLKLDHWVSEGRVVITESNSDGDIHRYICLKDDDPDVINEIEIHGYTRDPDVLDTWFSSALWPFSTIGWPQDTDALKTWNPGSVLCTAREIITLWVSRMVMTNLYFLDRLPFTDVFIHAMIQDGQGRKMSKSLGNGVDPLDIIHSHGSDAMRYTLASMTTTTQDVRMPVTKDPQTGRNTSDKFDLGRNFSNKLWNALRFALVRLEEARDEGQGQDHGHGLAERWILSRLARAVQGADTALGSYEFSNYVQGLYDFFWRDLCDWYIEAIKPTVKTDLGQQQVLAVCIDVSLRLLHPVMPFITEELWGHLNNVMPDRNVQGVSTKSSALLIRADWPKIDSSIISEDIENAFHLVQEIVGSLRQVRTTHQVPPRQNVTFSAQAPEASAVLVNEHKSLIETLANVTACEVGPNIEQPGDAVSASAGDIHLYLHGLMDTEAERARLTKRLDEVNKSIGALKGRLSNKKYVEKAPAHLVDETRGQLAAAEQECGVLQEQLAGL